MFLSVCIEMEMIHFTVINFFKMSNHKRTIFYVFYLFIYLLLFNYKQARDEVMTQYIKEVHFFFYVNENFSGKDS